MGLHRRRGQSPDSLPILRRAQLKSHPKLGIGTHESFKCKPPVETAWVRKNPGYGPGETRRKKSPLNVWLVDHSGYGALSKKGNGTRRVTSHLRFELSTGLSEFLRRDLTRPIGRMTNNRGDTATILEQPPLVSWLEERRGDSARWSTDQKRLLGCEKL